MSFIWIVFKLPYRETALLSCWSLEASPASSVPKQIGKFIWLKISLANKGKYFFFRKINLLSWIKVQFHECLGTNKATEIHRWNLAFGTIP